MTEQKPDLRAGDRVSVDLYGKTCSGEITRLARGGIIFVRLDHLGYERWFHAHSLTKA